MQERPQAVTLSPGWRGQFRDARDHDPVMVWNYAAKGWIRGGECSVLYGPSNCGKSALVCHLGRCIVTGRPFFGTRVRQGVVVHVGAEAPESILDRMRAYDIHDPAAAPYLVRRAPVDLSNQDEVQGFMRNLEEITEDTGQPIILVVFDTLARSMGQADENDASAMTEIARMAELVARSVGTHVMLVHHTGKDHDRGSRGSSALRGAVDTEICLRPQDDGSVVVTQEKQRTMMKGRSVRFTTESVVLGQDEDGEDRTTVRAVEMSGDWAMDASGSSGRRACDPRSAILTALHLRGLKGGRSREPFDAAEILAELPERVFGGAVRDSRLKSINRILTDLVKEQEPPVEGKPGAWRLRPAGGIGEVPNAA